MNTKIKCGIAALFGIAAGYITAAAKPPAEIVRAHFSFFDQLSYSGEHAVSYFGLDEAVYRNMWLNYQDARGSEADLDRAIETCRTTESACSPLMRAWVYSIDLLNMLPENFKKERALTASLFLTNNLTHEDFRKASITKFLYHQGNWMQTPLETFGKKHGAVICGDYTAALYETLLRAGFSDNELAIVGMAAGISGYHTALSIKVGDQKYILEDKVLVPYENYLAKFWYTAPPSAAGQNEGYVPLVEFDNTAFKTTASYRRNAALLTDLVDLTVIQAKSASNNLEQFFNQHPEIAQPFEMKRMQVEMLAKQSYP